MPPTPKPLLSSLKAGRNVSVDRIADIAVAAYRDKSNPSMIDLNRTLMFVQQAYRIEAVKAVHRDLDKVLTDYLDRVLERVTIFYTLMGISVKAAQDEGPKVPEAVHESAWSQALDQEAQQTAMEDLFSLPTIITTALANYQKVSETLGNKPRPGMLSEVKDRINASGRYLLGVLNTTKNRVLDSVKKAARAGWGPRRLINYVKSNIKKIVGQRATTASRTEAVRATNIGTTLAAKHAWNISHMSVVGCSMIEPNGPLYRGIPTCNIQNVPTNDANEVEFHPNHTGYWIISGMTDPDGVPPMLEVSAGSI